jgi:hypothetical protein
MPDFDWLAVGGRLCLDCDFLMQDRPGYPRDEACWSCQEEKARAEVALRNQTYLSAPFLNRTVPNFQGLGTVAGPR